MNGEPDCQFLLELWCISYHSRDVYLGSVVIPGSSVYTASKQEFPVLYDYSTISNTRQQDVIVMKTNYERMIAFDEIIQKQIEDITSSSIDLTVFEAMKEEDNHTLLCPVYLRDNSMKEKYFILLFQVS